MNNDLVDYIVTPILHQLNESTVGRIATNVGKLATKQTCGTAASNAVGGGVAGEIANTIVTNGSPFLGFVTAPGSLGDQDPNYMKKTKNEGPIGCTLQNYRLYSSTTKPIWKTYETTSYI